MPEVGYLGHNLSIYGISNGLKSHDVSQISRTNNIREMFVNNLATILQHLCTNLQENTFVGPGQRFMKTDLERPIAYTSKILTSAQRNYAQTHKEALSIIYGLRKFNQFLYEIRFVIVTDHKPLLATFNSRGDNNTLVANRLAQMQIGLNNYDYEIQYRATKDHGNSDVLSRFMSGKDAEFEKFENQNDSEMFSSIQTLTKHISTTNSQTLVNESQKDPCISNLITFTREGWPNKYKSLQSYSKIRNSLSVKNNCLFYRNRVIIHTSLQWKILNSYICDILAYTGRRT
ncbi:hypothetical protein RF11_09419 [Thelohanellus kitauei]|uniref:Reverse transcriptase RNase H-like domain-containing protein n=1 Tax=Thelohanellus kitauei TaxID=669202 RepID=A0A0C2NBH4_THEKT|nr:hypothetical protein RF11_09419 [Thelohanellus kitauei]